MTVEFHPAAQREVDEAQAWYEERSLFAASAFLRELSTAIQRILQTPGLYPTAEAGTRRILFERFPFTLYYRVQSDADNHRGRPSEAPTGLLVYAMTRPDTY